MPLFACSKARSSVLIAAFMVSPLMPSVASATPRLYRQSVDPHWFDGHRKFWYRNALPLRCTEYVRVDARRGERRAAFDHEALAAGLRAAGVANAKAERLPLDRLAFEGAGESFVFECAGRFWRGRDAGRSLAVIEGGLPPALKRGEQLSLVPRRSRGGGVESQIHFINRSGRPLTLYWVNLAGKRAAYGTLAAGAERVQHTYAQHVWELVGPGGKLVAAFVARADPTRAVARKNAPLPPRERAPEVEAPAPRRPRGVSPDGRWKAYIRDHDIYLEKRGDPSDATPRRLTKDGSADAFYGELEWASDARSLVAWRVHPVPTGRSHILVGPARGKRRARVQSRPYPLPGDPMSRYELVILDVEEGGRRPLKTEAVDFGHPRRRWAPDGRSFTYVHVDRGHQRLRLMRVDPLTGRSRNLIDERSKTFIWTTHGPGLPLFTYLDEQGAFIYASERDGWRHLYLHDARNGRLRKQITKGRFVVRGIERVDRKEKTLLLKVSGLDADQDPYLIHYVRVDFDGGQFTRLTRGDGTHSLEWSPDGASYLDRYSRVDLPPVTELRRSSDGALLCALERADVSELRASGWRPPVVYKAKGRDGETDIWGIICGRLTGAAEPPAALPIVEDIYAGPHGSFVPKSFSPYARYPALTGRGFAVVKIDGMGTAHRSKAFHDVCWQNLKDAGFPDRIAWIKAAAKDHPELDATRVGIYGTSAGGQSAMGALLFHGDFYKAAVACCGCHDNRLDKASWNEQWMGVPVGAHYAACSNVDQAHRLRGKLLLMVGARDTNVPPESTHSVAAALIAAGKDFDYLYMPGAGHSDGGAYGRRRRDDFFVRHLLGVEPPDRNKP